MQEHQIHEVAANMANFLRDTAIPSALKEEKFIVLKRSDLEEIIEHDKSSATIIIEGIHRYNAYRAAKGKPENDYIICNQDEPYADLVWGAILQGETEKLSHKNVEPTPDTHNGIHRISAKCPVCNQIRPFILFELEPDNLAPFAFYYECPACMVCSPLSLDDEKQKAKEKAKTNLESFAKLKLVSRKTSCTCTLHQKLTGDGCSVCNPEMEIDVLGQENEELKSALKAALDYIDAIPKEISFPEMPGFDRDWADSLL